MKIVILGGTRFIGRHVSKIAEERGHSVFVLHRGTHSAPLSPGVRELLIDRENKIALSQALKDIKADVLIDTFAMNEEQSRRTVEAIGNLVPHVVVLSSQDVYAQFGRLNGHATSVIEDRVTEKSPMTVPFPFKGIAEHEGGANYDKKDVESVFSAACENLFAAVTTLRLPAVFGSYDYQRRFGSIIDYIDSGKTRIPCQNHASWRWTMGHVENIASAIVLTVEKKADGYRVFNLGEKTTPTMRERVERISQLMEISIEWEELSNLPDAFSMLGKMPNDFVVDTTAFRSAFGYEETLSEDECYRDLIGWCRKSRK